MTTKIIYHEIRPGIPCVDGIASAWVARKVYPKADLIGCVYNSVLPTVVAGDRLVIVDFSFPAAQLEQWADMGCEIQVIDHHQTAMNDLSSLSSRIAAQFDMAECGATLAWKCFFYVHPIPAFLNYVKDRDLWEFKLPMSEEIHEAVGFIGRSFALFDVLEPLSQEQLIAVFAPMGKRLLEPKRKRIAEIGETAFRSSVAGHEIWVVEIYQLEARLTSDVCSYLYKKYPDVPFVMSFSKNNEGYQLGFRSDKNGSDFDVSVIAKRFGGGGHRNSAGATVKNLSWS